jgi:hypothetical protein
MTAVVLGKETEYFGMEKLRPLGIYGEPTVYPTLPKDHKVIAKYDQSVYVLIIVCENIQDMQEVYQSYYLRGAVRLSWFSGEDPGFLFVV